MTSYQRSQKRDVNVQHTLVTWVDWKQRLKRTLSRSLIFKIVDRHRIRGDQSAFRADLRGHVREDDTFVHRQAVDVFSAEFHRAIGAAIHAEQTRDVNHHILGVNAGLGFSTQFHMDGLRHFEPAFTSDPCHADLGRAEPSSKCAHRAIGIRVRVRADDDGPRRDKAFFDHHLMTNALLKKIG